MTRSQLLFVDHSSGAQIVDKVFQLLPSINGIKTTDGYKVVIPKTLDQLTNEAVDMKMHLETRMNVKGSEFLLKSVEYVIYMVALFSSEIVLPTFDWNTRRYPEQHLEIPLMKIEKTCKLAERRLKLSKSGLVLPGFDSRGIAQVNSVNGNETDKAYACVPSSSDPNRKLPQPSDLSLDGKEKKIWLEFKEFDKWNLEGVTRSIQLDHPIVSFIGDFAVAAFNKACEMFVKKDEHNNLHDIEYMACRYLKFPKAYHFYMIIEAIEEGNLGVYETEVVCSSDGNVNFDQVSSYRYGTSWHKSDGSISLFKLEISMQNCGRCGCGKSERVEKSNECYKRL